MKVRKAAARQLRDTPRCARTSPQHPTPERISASPGGALSLRPTGNPPFFRLTHKHPPSSNTVFTGASRMRILFINNSGVRPVCPKPD